MHRGGEKHEHQVVTPCLLVPRRLPPASLHCVAISVNHRIVSTRHLPVLMARYRPIASSPVGWLCRTSRTGASPTSSTASKWKR